MRTLFLWLLIAQHSTAAPRGPVAEVFIERISDSLISLNRINDGQVGLGNELALFSGTDPVARAAFAGVEDGKPIFALRTTFALVDKPYRTFLIGRSLPALTSPGWPEQTTLHAEIDSIGPGGQSAWIAAGTDDGIAVGDSWWLRIGGQPAARCDVLHVAPRACFCSVVPLANKPTTVPGTRVALWPGPAERREQRANSAVAFTEARGENTLVWIAAPPECPCPPDTRVDFYRAAQYLGHGLVERHDEWFWYVLFIAPAHAAPAPKTAAPQVGDDAIIRTSADIAQRRFITRVFDLTPDGALLNAGEADALTVGDTLTVFRAAQAVGQAVVRQVRRTYSVAGPADPAGALELRVGDELRLRPPPPSPRVIGSLERVVDRTLFRARLTDRTAPLGVPLALQSDGRTVGVAILAIRDESGQAGGFVFPCSLSQPLATGMHLLSAGGDASR